MSMTRREMMAVLPAALMIPIGGPGGRRGDTAFAAPVPKEKPDVGMIWMVSPTTGRLDGYTPDGKQARAVKLAGGPIHPMTFLGVTGDGQDALFAGRNGVIPAGTKAGYEGLHARALTVHLRPLFGGGKIIDTGIPCRYGDRYVCGLDGRTLFVTRDVAAPVPAGKEPNEPVYETTAYDLVTFEGVRQPALPKTFFLHEVMPNGDRLLSRYVFRGRPLQSFHLRPAGGGKAKLLTGDDETDFCTLSRDGTKLLVTRQCSLKAKPGDSFQRMFVIDRATGSASPIAEHDDTLMAQGHWSPDGKSIVYEWYEEGKRPAFQALGDAKPVPIGRGEVVVCDAHGGKAKVILKLEGCADDDLTRVQDWSQNRTRLVGWYPTRAWRKMPRPGNLRSPGEVPSQELPR